MEAKKLILYVNDVIKKHRECYTVIGENEKKTILREANNIQLLNFVRKKIEQHNYNIENGIDVVTNKIFYLYDFIVSKGEISVGRSYSDRYTLYSDKIKKRVKRIYYGVADKYELLCNEKTKTFQFENEEVFNEFLNRIYGRCPSKEDAFVCLLKEYFEMNILGFQTGYLDKVNIEYEDYVVNRKIKEFKILEFDDDKEFDFIKYQCLLYLDPDSEYFGLPDCDRELLASMHWNLDKREECFNRNIDKIIQGYKQKIWSFEYDSNIGITKKNINYILKKIGSLPIDIDFDNKRIEFGSIYDNYRHGIPYLFQKKNLDVIIKNVEFVSGVSSMIVKEGLSKLDDPFTDIPFRLYIGETVSFNCSENETVKKGEIVVRFEENFSHKSDNKEYYNISGSSCFFPEKKPEACYLFIEGHEIEMRSADSANASYRFHTDNVNMAVFLIWAYFCSGIENKRQGIKNLKNIAGEFDCDLSIRRIYNY